MSLTQLINRPCVLLVRSATGTTDDYGNVIPSEGTVQTVCEAQPRSAVEPELASELSDEDWAAFFLPADAAYLNAASGVWIPELGEFEVIGRPPNWRNPRTEDFKYVQANLKRTAGAEDELS